MSDITASIAQHYHERTKYNPETINAKQQPLNWSQQPLPFKEYKIGVSIALKPYLTDDPTAFVNDPTGFWWQRLSRLFFCSYGLTGSVPTSDTPHYLRSAPSAGGLYPAELYLISRGTPLLPAGLIY